MNINVKYKNLVEKIYKEGFTYEDPNRKGVRRKQIGAHRLEHKFSEGFPIIGLKQTYPKMAFNEMLAFMRGYTHLSQLEELGITFWRKDAYNYAKKRFGNLPYEDWEEIVKDSCHKFGDLGKIYSRQIRKWDGFLDQLDVVLNKLKENPHTTKNIVTMWNPSDMNSCALSPCHRSFEFIVESMNIQERIEYFLENASESEFGFYNDVPVSRQEAFLNSLGTPKHKVTVQWEQSSVDTFLGLPMNIMYYAFVCQIFAHYLGMKPEGVIGNLSNVHLYDNSFKVVEELLSRDASSLEEVVLKTNFPKNTDLLDEYLLNLSYGENISIIGYKHMGRLDVEMLAYNK